MNVYRWFANRFSSRSKALALYRSGMTRANRHDHQRAIEDYTHSIELPDAPMDVIAMATYNRALVYVANGDFSKAAADLDAVLEMDKAPLSIKKMAKQKLSKRKSRSHDTRV